MSEALHTVLGAGAKQEMTQKGADQQMPLPWVRGTNTPQQGLYVLQPGGPPLPEGSTLP